MTTGIDELRAQVEGLEVTGRGRRYPEVLRERLVDAVEQLRARGATWTRIGAQLGMTAETARRWVLRMRAPARKRETALVSVEVTPARATGLTLVSPTGYRVEGLDVESAAALLRRLS